mgnify:CR=1 FL=1
MRTLEYSKEIGHSAVLKMVTYHLLGAHLCKRPRAAFAALIHMFLGRSSRQNAINVCANHCRPLWYDSAACARCVHQLLSGAVGCTSPRTLTKLQPRSFENSASGKGKKRTNAFVNGQRRVWIRASGPAPHRWRSRRDAILTRPRHGAPCRRADPLLIVHPPLI